MLSRSKMQEIAALEGTARLEAIASCFDVAGAVVSVEPLGNGLINDTFRVTTAGGEYVLQRINNAIFRDVALLQRNIEAVTRHIRLKLEAAGVADVDRRVLTLVPLRDGSATFLQCGGEFWRMTLFIRGSHTCEEVTPETSYLAGRAFGEFEAMLSDIPDEIGETIPDFHNMELRARQLDEAVAADRAGRLAADGGAGVIPESGPDGASPAARPGELHEILDFFSAHRERMCMAERLYREGRLPKRICHCDTKVNNMLFDENGQVLCVIDLDTVMPSFVFSDFGDFMRTAASTVPEDWQDVAAVDFRKDIYEAFSRGYQQSAACFLTPLERENLPFAVQLFPFMQAVRFFTDYLNGDTYYKIAYPEHNLVRTRNQVALFHAAMAKVPQMKSFIEKI